MAFPDNCSPRLIQVDESCGCTLTRADIRAMTPQDFEDQGFKEVYMDRVIAQTKEARIAGVPQRSLTDLLLSRFAPIKQQAVDNGGSVIAPYILIPQRTIFNANYWQIEDGEATPGAGTGSIPASAWNLTVINSAGQFASDLAAIQNYFLPGRNIIVLRSDPVTGVSRTLQYKVLASANADSGGVYKATVTVEPNYSAAGWAALSGPQKAVYQVTSGFIINLANSVSDYESWCYNDAAVNNMKLLTFWLQTIRETHCYSDAYLQALQAPLTSEYFKKFRELPLAQQRKQQELLAQKAFYDTVFFGQRITEQQTTSTYQNLPQVRDPLNPNCTLEYKANTLGLYTQLNDCGRVIDMQGGALDMDVVKGLLYSLKRTRENTGAEIMEIDAMTDRFTADNLLTLMIQYYKDKYGMDTTRFYKPGEAIRHDNQVLWNYNKYQFPEEGVTLNVITDYFFDDHLSAAAAAGQAARGRYLWMIDWSDVKIGIAKTSSVQRQTNIADNIYNCVITPNVQHYMLRSKTIAVMVQDPNRHSIITGFSDACPRLTVTACTPYES